MNITQLYKSPLRLKNNGQSVIEYVMIATIIFLGIIIGGPVLMRAVQGYFKIVDESTQDSASEKFVQDGLHWRGKNCQCSSGRTTPAVSGGTTLDFTGWTQGECNIGSCSVTQRLYSQTCSPMKCGQEEVCVQAPDCCTPPTLMSCGTKIDDSTIPADNQCTSRVTPALHTGFSGTFNQTCTGTTPNCAVGERLYKIDCGGDGTSGPNGIKTHYACKKPDNGEVERACLPTCWEYPFPGSKRCNDPENSRNMFNENLAIENEDTISLPQRRALINEVIYRLKTTPTTTSANRTNSGDISFGTTLDVSKGHLDTLPANQHNPYRILTKTVEISDRLRFKAYRNHFVYLKSTECQQERYCERTCPGGYGPNFEGDKGQHENESCAFNACWYGWLDYRNGPPGRSTIHGQRICDSQAQPKICPKTLPNGSPTPEYDLDICGYLALCSYGTGASYQSSDPDITIYQRTAEQPCQEGEKRIADPNPARGDRFFCYKTKTPQICPYNTALPPAFNCSSFSGTGNPGEAGEAAAASMGALFYVVFGCDN